VCCPYNGKQLARLFGRKLDASQLRGGSQYRIASVSKVGGNGQNLNVGRNSLSLQVLAIGHFQAGNCYVYPKQNRPSCL
jgi:hypothetical protein